MSKRIPWGPDSPGYPNCPVPAGHDVTVWFRNGRHFRDKDPKAWHWGYSKDHTIIAYCDHDAQDEARELLAAVGTLRDTMQIALNLLDEIKASMERTA